ncbi:MAG: hypothetical protein U1A78_01520 [Polyangia bacterium]
MRKPWSTPLSLLLAACCTAGGLVGCSEHTGLGPAPAYEGCATDENWVTFDDYITTARIKTDAASSPTWLEPTSPAALSGTSAPSLRFQPSPSVPGSANGDASCPQFTPQRRAGVTPLHLPPVSGTTFDVHFAVDGADAFRVLTTRQSTSVPLAIWKGWAGKRVTVTLYSARLLKNEVVEGPFRAAPLEISVSP